MESNDTAALATQPGEEAETVKMTDPVPAAEDDVSWLTLIEMASEGSDSQEDNMVSDSNDADNSPLNEAGNHDDNPENNTALATELILHTDQNDRLFLEQTSVDMDLSSAADKLPSTITEDSPAAEDNSSPETSHFIAGSGTKRRQGRKSAWRPFPALSPPSYRIYKKDAKFSRYKSVSHLNESITPQDTAQAASGLSFMLLAVQSDPTIMYRDDYLSFDEQVNRSIESTFGMTIVCLDHRDPLNLRSKGMCIRSKWKRMDQKTYHYQRPLLIFRDKFCNYRNFRDINRYVIWKNPSLYQGSFNRPSTRQISADNQIISSANSLNSMCSTYQFRRIPLLDYKEPALHPAPTEGEKRYRFTPFYNQILRFITHSSGGESNIRLYHRLPQNMLWLAEDMQLYAASLDNPVIIDFIKMRGTASNPYISGHCIYRPNHNTVTCEICLFETYLPQLLAEINNSVTITE